MIFPQPHANAESKVQPYNGREGGGERGGKRVGWREGMKEGGDGWRGGREGGNEGVREGVMEGGRCVLSFAPLLLERDSASLQPCLQEKH